MRADDAGAVFSYTVELEPRGGMRLLSPLLGPIVRSGLRRDLQTLKTVLDERPPGAAWPAGQAAG